MSETWVDRSYSCRDPPMPIKVDFQVNDFSFCFIIPSIFSLIICNLAVLKIVTSAKRIGPKIESCGTTYEIFFLLIYHPY